MAKAVKKTSDNQAKKFRELARELDTDLDESRFNEKLGKIAKSKPTSSAEMKSTKPKK
jgi:hypothetical protein